MTSDLPDVSQFLSTYQTAPVMASDCAQNLPSSDSPGGVSRLIGSWVEWLIANGVDHFFLAPGSRNTPLTLAIASHPKAIVAQHIDERGLAFACLGYGRATGRAAAFVCTSGTAAANALPAVIEASIDHVPMLLLTADRPPELRDTAANQTIDQVKLFGVYPRWQFDLPCPTAPVTENFWYSCFAHAIQASATGPVHLNCMFREPFDVPASEANSRQPDDATCVPRLESKLAWKSSLHVEQTCRWQVPPGTTIVTCGQAKPNVVDAAARLAERLECPFVCDVTNGQRGVFYDLQLMRSNQPTPDNVIHVGGRIASKRWLTFLTQQRPANYLLLTDRPNRQDPSHLLPTIVQGDLVALCDGAVLPARDATEQAAVTKFREQWQRESATAITTARAQIDNATAVTEPGVAQDVSELAPDGTCVFLGNSMPIRDFDSFGEFHKRVRVFANRGASGIDGLIATAAGISIGARQQITIVLGDLSSLHDLNSIMLLTRTPAPPILIVINNDGGGIFHFLPVADRAANFEQMFGTPHGLRFELAAQLFGLDYVNPKTRPEFRDAYGRALVGDRPCLIEIETVRSENLQLHQRIQAAVAAAGEI